MKIIGEKLSKQGMLNVKGGEAFYYLCQCAHNNGTWEFTYFGSGLGAEQEALETAAWACESGPGHDYECQISPITNQ